MNAVAESASQADKEFLGVDTPGFFSLTQDGTLKIIDLFRAWERLAPLWWQHVTGTSRDAYWKSVGHFIVARYAKVTCAAQGLEVGTRMLTRLVTSAGTRPRGAGGQEAGAVDRFEMRREADGLLVGAVEQAWTWIDASGAKPVVAAAPPPGLHCIQHALAPVPTLPQEDALEEIDRFTWSARETDPNRHVSFLSYFDRADDALVKAEGSAGPGPFSWESWYRRECLAGEPMKMLSATRRQDGLQIEIAGANDDIRRVVMRHRKGLGTGAA